MADGPINLALVPSVRGDKVDIVTIDDDERVVDIVPKPGPGISGWTWVAAAWSATFTDFMHEQTVASSEPRDREIYVGDVLNAARASGMTIKGVRFEHGWAIDIGTPDDFLGRATCDAEGRF